MSESLPSCGFADTIPIPPGCEVWGLDQPLTGRTLIFRFDGTDLFVDDVNLTSQAESDEILRHWEQDFSRVKELMATGYSLQGAVKQARREMNCLPILMRQAYLAAGRPGVDSVLAKSTLVDSVKLYDTYASVWIGHIPELHIGYAVPSDIQPMQRQRRFSERLRTTIEGIPEFERVLVLVTPENVSTVAGTKEIAAARAQIVHVARCRCINGLPPGPFRHSAPELYDLVRYRGSRTEVGPNKPLPPPSAVGGQR